MRANPATAVVCQPLLDAAECDAALDRLAGRTWQDMRVAVPSAGSAVERTIRSGAVVELADDPAVARAQAFVLDLNRRLFELDVTGVPPTDPPLAMRYRPGDHFDWHIDNGTDAVATRKLSFTLQLTEPARYDGGDLELALYAPAYNPGAAAYARDIRRRGAITVFAAFQLHRVSPVTRGERVALVGWVHGPRFR